MCVWLGWGVGRVLVKCKTIQRGSKVWPSWLIVCSRYYNRNPDRLKAKCLLLVDRLYSNLQGLCIFSHSLNSAAFASLGFIGLESSGKNPSQEWSYRIPSAFNLFGTCMALLSCRECMAERAVLGWLVCAFWKVKASCYCHLPNSHSWPLTSWIHPLVGLEGNVLRSHMGRCHFCLGHLHRELVTSLGGWSPITFKKGSSFLT